MNFDWILGGFAALGLLLYLLRGLFVGLLTSENDHESSSRKKEKESSI
jgi:hypothetical protein